MDARPLDGNRQSNGAANSVTPSTYLHMRACVRACVRHKCAHSMCSMCLQVRIMSRMSHWYHPSAIRLCLYSIARFPAMPLIRLEHSAAVYFEPARSNAYPCSSYACFSGAPYTNPSHPPKSTVSTPGNESNVLVLALKCTAPCIHSHAHEVFGDTGLRFIHGVRQRTECTLMKGGQEESE